MLDWLKRKAGKKQKRNVRETLFKLIQVLERGRRDDRAARRLVPAAREAIHKLQNQLLMDFIGPIA